MESNTGILGVPAGPCTKRGRFTRFHNKTIDRNMWVINQSRSLILKGMTERESTDERDRQKLQDIFVSVTGETVVTERQDRETDKKAIEIRESELPPSDQRVGTDSAGNGLEDAIGGRKSK